MHEQDETALPAGGDRAGRIACHARALGFDAIAFARADQALDDDHDRYQQFIDGGRHGQMGYLARHQQARRRLDSAAIIEGALTVVCLAWRYDRAASDEATDPPLAKHIARYARGRDYHNHLRKRLRRLARFIVGMASGIRARALCDTAPVLERAWAARAGLGFIGKNGMLIVPGQGSYCLLGEVVTTLAVEAAAFVPPARSRCGSCQACLDACPTAAFDGPYVLDPRRCVSYATIESRELPPADLQEAIAPHLFGCDACQQPCPYNRAPAPADRDLSPFLPLPVWAELELGDLVRLDQGDGWVRLAGSPVRRATQFGLARNALLVAAAQWRSGDQRAERALTAALASSDPRIVALARRGLEPAGKKKGRAPA